MIRLAKKEDLPAIIEIENELFPKDRFSPPQFRYYLHSKSIVLLVATCHSHIAGYALLFFFKNRARGHLYSLGVSGTYQGRGYGKALLKACEKITKQKKKRGLQLEVRINNTPAKTLYMRQGYVKTTRYKDFYADGTGAFRMEKDF